MTTMTTKHIIRSLLALSGLLLSLASPLSAQMNYQGRLTDSNGAPITGNQATVRFSLYDSETAGTKVWGDFDVNADLLEGRFNVVIGPNDSTGSSINEVFTQQLYLQITLFDDQDPPQPILPALPRQQILNAPYALGANNANHAKTADTATALSNGSGTSPLNVNFTTGNVGIGTTAPGQKLDVAGNAKVSGNLILPNTSAGGAGGRIQWGSSHIHNYGSRNFFAGQSAGNFTMTGSSIVGVGYQALINNSSGSSNTAIGSSAMESNNSGGNNTAIGQGALLANTTGSNNLALGFFAGSQITTGGNNIAIGNSGAAGATSTIWLGTEGTHTKTIVAGNVGIGTSAPSAKLDVAGDIGLSGKIHYNRDRVINLGDKSTLEGGWVQTQLDLSRWADNVHGCVIRLYLQAETDKSTKIREWHVLFEQDGIIDNPEWGTFRRLSFKALGGQEVNTTVGNPDRNGSFRDLWNDGWVVLSTYIQNDRTGEAGGNLMYTSPLPILFIAIHPHIVGRLTIADR